MQHLPPAVRRDSARGKQIASGPLAAALLPTVLIEAPPPLPLPLHNGSSEVEVARAVARWGSCICHGDFGSLIADAAREAAALHADGAMQPHGFVRDGKRLPVPGASSSGYRYGNRDDTCVMLSFDEGDPHRAHTPALAALDAAIEASGRRIIAAMGALEARERAPMGDGPNGEALSFSARGDLMVAAYPGGGTAHGVHIDNADGDGRQGRDFGRVLIMIAYLNAPWDRAADGGALRTFVPAAVAAREERVPGGNEVAPAWDVWPEAGTVAVTRADRVMHEVRPCTGRHRLAASVWLCCGPKSEGAHERSGEESGSDSDSAEVLYLSEADGAADDAAVAEGETGAPPARKRKRKKKSKSKFSSKRGEQAGHGQRQRQKARLGHNQRETRAKAQALATGTGTD